MSLVSRATGYVRKAFPDHWSFLLGEIALYSLVVLVVTGLWLTLFFRAGMSDIPYLGPYGPLRGVPVSHAFDSVLRISFDVRGGLLVRQTHHWAALVFVAAIGCHLLRVFFTGAFRRPREANWTIGLTMFLLALLEGFCGSSLPDDLLSGTGLRTAHGIVLSIPVAGTYLALFLFGGEYPGHDIIPRLFYAHVLLVPGLLLLLVRVHLGLVVKLKHTHWAAPGHSNRNVVGRPLFPQYMAKSAGLFCTVAGVLFALGGLLQVNPVWEFGPYRPDRASTEAQPDWYVGYLEGALRLMPAWETHVAGHTIAWDVFLPGVVLPAVLFGGLYLFPWAERWVTGPGRERHLCDRPRNQPTRTALGAAGVCFYAVLLMAGAQDVLAYVLRLPVEGLTYAFRMVLVVGPLLTYRATKQLCLSLQAADRRRLEKATGTGVVRLAAADGHREGRVGLGRAEAYRILMRDTPRPRTHGTEPGRFFHRHRIRNRLSAWYFGARVPLPVTEQQAGAVQALAADPEEAGRAAGADSPA
nr:cytochrome b N-terminal domain-containing protein [Streptomyces mashuensis]